MVYLFKALTKEVALLLEIIILSVKISKQKILLEVKKERRSTQLQNIQFLMSRHLSQNQISIKIVL